MKAIDYANKYQTKINEITTNEQFADVTIELFNELRDEMFKMAETRHVKSYEGIMSLIKEFNIKANKIKNLCQLNVADNWFEILMKDIMRKAEDKLKNSYV